MRILHIYPKADSLLAQYVDLLSKGMAAEATSLATDDPVAFKQMCRELKPDIVHQHGQLDWTIPAHARLVVTPHGMAHSRNAYTYVARSDFEYKQLADLGLLRIETIRNPLITKTTTAEKLVAQYRLVYQQVMDSNVLELMDADTLTALRMLLKAGITGDSRWLGPTPKLPEQIDWRKLIIYVRLEGVEETLIKGCAAMNVQPPTIPPVKSYLPDKYTKPTTAHADDVVQLVGIIQKSVADGQLPLLRLVELDQLLRRDNIEDDLLLKELEKEKLKPLFTSLLQLLQEQTLLDEGFMPCQPTNNHETSKLRNLLKSHLLI